ncbi:hypothetical protein ES677_06490 [Bizionia gelidisalsuginis]|uniref:Uncharacterized protein n=2 Tax=Bizionia TaxID=283785 RepID=A0A8H2LFA8_9FLAO|nr:MULTISPECIES: hypothetical protein [Bizionia]TYB76620.1 hypothetical protein ES676_04560 [Bizionia saleffrena]TYC14187.1 hypothetical protein ES677_06490 [Bizionia gelidisalsuginis]
MPTKTHYFILFIALFLATSCSDDDNTTVDTTENSSIYGNYFPTFLDSYWNYTVEAQSSITTDPIISTDELTVESINNNNFTLTANDGLPANGTMSGILVSGTLTSSNTTLSLNGTLELPAGITDLIDFDIALNSAILYDINASNNTNLFSVSEQVTQDIQGFPVTINYDVNTKSLGFYNSVTVNDETYTNVVATEIVLSLGAATSIDFGGIPINVAILAPQDLFVVTSYYAENVGLIKAESYFNYEINATAIAALANSGIDLGIPATGSSNNIQELIGFGLQ